jgi:hypothetical protein
MLMNDLLKISGELRDAELVIDTVMKRGDLLPFQHDDLIFKKQNIQLQRGHLLKLLIDAKYWTMVDKTCPSILRCDLVENNLPAMAVIQRSYQLINELKSDQTLSDTLASARKFRAIFNELIVTEESLIKDYQLINKEEECLRQIIDKASRDVVFNITLTRKMGYLTRCKESLVKFRRIQNCLTVTPVEGVQLVDNIFYITEWLQSKVINADFMNYYENKLLPCALFYTSYAEIFATIRDAIGKQDAKLILDTKEQKVLGHIDQKLSGAFQRLGRYKLLIEDLLKTLPLLNVLAADSSHLHAVELNLNSALTYIEKQNKTIVGTLGAYEYPTRIRTNLNELMMRMRQFNEQLGGSQSPLLSNKTFISGILQNLLKSLDEISLSLDADIKSQSREVINVDQLLVFEVYARKIREALRACAKAYESHLYGVYPNLDYKLLQETELFKLMEQYLNVFQPVDEADKQLLSEQATLPSNAKPNA